MSSLDPQPNAAQADASQLGAAQADASRAIQFDASRFARGLTPGPLASEQARATRLLRERLDEEDVAEIEQLIRDTPGAWEH